MTTLADLVDSLWQRFRPARIQEPAEATLRKLGLARQDEEGVWRPTVSGILMASSDPRRHLPNVIRPTPLMIAPPIVGRISEAHPARRLAGTLPDAARCALSGLRR